MAPGGVLGDMNRSTASLILLAGVLATPAPASATTFVVNQSAPNAGDSNACLKTAPCLTIAAAVSKAQASTGNAIRVNPDPGGTKDVYNENLILSGPNPITLTGAGSALTEIHAPTGSNRVSNASTVRSVGFDKQVFADGAGSILERVTVTQAGAVPAYQGQATVRDSVFATQKITAVLHGGRLVRTTVIGELIADASADILDSTIRAPQTAAGLAVFASVTVRARHVTVFGGAERVLIGGTARLEASDSTFAGPGGTADLRVDGNSATLALSTTDVAPSRTVFSGGALASQLTTTDPIDAEPGLTADGHLTPGSALIDRGSAGGVLAGDPDDALDVDGTARTQSAATDVGSDETGSPAVSVATGPPAAIAPDRTPASLTSLKVPRRFHATCPRPRRHARRKACKAGASITYRLSEPALVQFAFKRRRRGARVLKVARPVSAGKVNWRFSGKIKGRVLPKGEYDLAISTTDFAGNRSKPIKRRVTVN
jgi:hypothetical protein